MQLLIIDLEYGRIIINIFGEKVELLLEFDACHYIQNYQIIKIVIVLKNNISNNY